MGGCCCSSRKPRFHGTPVYYYYPQGSEEHDSLTSHDGIATVRASALLIDLNLNMSTPDTYRPPPAPIPYDVVFGRPESTDPQSGEVTISAHTLEKPSCIVLKEANCLKESEILPISPRKVDLEFFKSEPHPVSTYEDDPCPTCLEEYDKENPKILTKCSHHFHLSCILEWRERSNTCPICDQELILPFSCFAVPRKSDFSLDVRQIAEVVEQEKPKCIFLTSPNNPDGSTIDDETLRKILDLPILVVLDETYIEFSGLESRMGWVKKHENLIVLRTFSKRAALAGLRIGYGAFPLSIIEYLWRAKQPYNVSAAAENAACAALQNPAYLENVKVALVQERDRLFKLLKDVPFLNPYPSHSNFFLCEVESNMPAKKLKEDLAKMGVMIRHYSNKELAGYVRVSVSKPEHTDVLMECLRRLY